MKKIAYVTWGASSQIISFHDFSRYLDDMLYLRELESCDLTQYAAVVLPDSMEGGLLGEYAQQLNDYVRSGGFLIAFHIEGIDEWLDVVDIKWLSIHTRDWLWWTKPDGRLEIHQPEPKHPICDAIPLKTMSWHWKGAYALTPGAVSALNIDDDSASLLLDYQGLENGGRVMVSTLDPHHHNGERFMPATTQFLRAFYPWLNRELGIERPARRDFSVTYVQCQHHPTEWSAPGLAETFEGTGGTLRLHPLYELGQDVLDATDILFVPQIQDQFFLRDLQPLLLEFLARGGHLVLCSEPAIQWLPFLCPFQPVPPRPFTNIKVRVRNDPFGFYQNMDRDFDGWKGIFGQYARGWSDMPPGAVWLTDIGTQEDPKPADWLWQYPADDGRGGKVVMHTGDNLMRYPDHGDHKSCLLRDICLGLIEHEAVTLNRF